MELVGSVLLVCLCLGSFGIIEGSIVSDIFAGPANMVIAKITCSITNSSITFYHKGGFIVNNWSLLVNGSMVEQGSGFKIGDTITYPYSFTETRLIELVGDGKLLFFSLL